MTKLDDYIKKAVDNETWLLYKQPSNKKCPNCELLENFLKLNNIEFENIDIYTPEAATELAMHYCFPIYTPVLQKGYFIYYKQLWLEHGKKLNLSKIKWILDPDKKDWIDLDGEIECKDGVCKI